MRRAARVVDTSALGLLVFLLAISPATAEQRSMTVTLRAAVVDRHLDLRPVPRALFLIDGPGGEVVADVRTSFDGTASLIVQPGKYRLRSDSCVTLDDRCLSWNVEFEAVDHDIVVELSNDNARSTPRESEEKAASFRAASLSTVTILTEFTTGSGFVVREDGLVVTSEHVIRGTDYIAVQFDAVHKRRAVLLAADRERDLAVLRVSLAGIPGAVPVQIATPERARKIVEGDEVWTIGSPLGQEHVFSKGIISKVEPDILLCDVAIDRGSSGSPLFDARGEVIGVMTFVSESRFAGAVRTDPLLPLLGLSTVRMATQPKPDPGDLPTEPSIAFPGDVIATRIASGFDPKSYRLADDDFEVLLFTPVSEGAMEPAGGDVPSEKPRVWMPALGTYKAVIRVLVRPRLRETRASKARRDTALASRAAGLEVDPGPPSLSAASVSRIRLLCDGEVVTPIHPTRVAVRPTPNANPVYVGFYTYSPEAVSDACRTILLEITAADASVHKLPLGVRTIAAVSADFAPIRNALHPAVETTKAASLLDCP